MLGSFLGNTSSKEMNCPSFHSWLYSELAEEYKKLDHLAMQDQEVNIWLADKTIFWL